METLDNGAHAYVSKEEGRDHLVEAVLAAAADRPYVDPVAGQGDPRRSAPGPPSAVAAGAAGAAAVVPGHVESIGRAAHVDQREHGQAVHQPGRAPSTRPPGGPRRARTRCSPARSRTAWTRPDEIVPYQSFARAAADHPNLGATASDWPTTPKPPGATPRRSAAGWRTPSFPDHGCHCHDADRVTKRRAGALPAAPVPEGEQSEDPHSGTPSRAPIPVPSALRCRCGVASTARRDGSGRVHRSRDRGSAGRYRLEGLLGRGGLGEVWRCRDLGLNREVAVKILLAGVPDPGEAPDQFRRDAESAARLRHPGITAVFDVVSMTGECSLSWSCCTARIWPGCCGGIPAASPVSQALSIGVAVAAALAYARPDGDRAPRPEAANISSPDDGTVRVCDFGVARDLNAAPATGAERSQARRTTSRLSGRAGEPVDAERGHCTRSACTLYEVLTGQPPFQGPSLPALIPTGSSPRSPSPRT